jgi:hypothetical protein
VPSPSRDFSPKLTQNSFPYSKGDDPIGTNFHFKLKFLFSCLVGPWTISSQEEMLAMPERQVSDEYEDGAVDVHHAVLVQVLLQVDDAQDEGYHLKQ